MLRRHLASSFLLVLVACAEGGADDPTKNKVDGATDAVSESATDAAGDAKADATDARPDVTDGGPDATSDGTVDATGDSTFVDSGVLGDTGDPDTAPSDTGDPDTGTPDTGTPDSGTTDTGTTDTGIVLFPCTKDTDCSSPFNCCVLSSKSCGVKVIISCVPFP